MAACMPPTNIGRYDDSLNASSTGNVYGFFLAQLRNGGPAAFAGNGSGAKFSTTSYTYQVLGDTPPPGATMQTTFQPPAGTTVVSVAISNPEPGYKGNQTQGDITVNAYAIWSFTYNGPSISGALQYNAQTAGSYSFNLPALLYVDTTQDDSFTATIEVFDVTTNGVSASGVVESLLVQKSYSGTKEQTFDFGSGIKTGTLPMQFLQGHQYQVKAGLDCSMSEDNYPAWLHPYSLDITLCVQGLAITFD